MYVNFHFNYYLLLACVFVLILRDTGLSNIAHINYFFKEKHKRKDWSHMVVALTLFYKLFFFQFNFFFAFFLPFFFSLWCRCRILSYSAHNTHISTHYSCMCTKFLSWIHKHAVMQYRVCIGDIRYTKKSDIDDALLNYFLSTIFFTFCMLFPIKLQIKFYSVNNWLLLYPFLSTLLSESRNFSQNF